MSILILIINYYIVDNLKKNNINRFKVGILQRYVNSTVLGVKYENQKVNVRLYPNLSLSQRQKCLKTLHFSTKNTTEKYYRNVIWVKCYIIITDIIIITD